MLKPAVPPYPRVDSVQAALCTHNKNIFFEALQVFVGTFLKLLRRLSYEQEHSIFIELFYSFTCRM